MALPTPADLKHYLEMYDQCDICKFPVFTLDKRVKRHGLCQREYQKAVSRQYGRLYRRLHREGLGAGDVTEDQRKQVHREAFTDTRITIKEEHSTEIAAIVENSRRKESERIWERFKRERDEDDPYEPPIESRAFDFEAGAVEYGYETWEDHWKRE